MRTRRITRSIGIISLWIQGNTVRRRCLNGLRGRNAGLNLPWCSDGAGISR